MRYVMRAVVLAVLMGYAVDAMAWVNEWHAIGPAGGNVNKIAFSTTADTVLLIAANGLYRSQDGGQTWLLTSNNFYNAPNGLALDPSDATRLYVTAPNSPSVYVSTDGGATLAPAANLPTAVTQAQQVVVSQNGGTVYVTSGSSMFRSVDRGQSWQQRTSFASDSIARALKLVVDPTDPQTLYAVVMASATTYTYLATHDGANTWQTLATGSSSVDLAFDLIINAANPRQLWEARDTGIWRSNDRGVSWTNVFATPMFTIAIDPSNSAVMYAGTGYGQIFRSRDSGSTWYDVSGNVGAGENVTIAVDPLHPTHVMVGGMTGLASSATSGNQWSMTQSGLNATAMDSFSADPGADRIFIDVPSAGLYVDTGGSGAVIPVNNASLLRLGSPNRSLYVSAMLATQGNLFASLPTGLATSTDSGNSWRLTQVVPVGARQLFSMVSPAATPQTILAAGSPSLYRSTDGGDLWTQVTSGLPADGIFAGLVTAASDPNVAYGYLYSIATGASGGPSTLLGLHRSDDAGATWHLVNSAQTISTRLLAVDSTAASTLYRASDTDFSTSNDGGRTWMPLSWDRNAASGYPGVMAIDPVHPKIWYAGSSGRIARSVDSGATWQTLRSTPNIGSLFAYSMLVDPKRPERLLVGTSASGVQQIIIAPDLSLTSVAPTTVIATGSAAALPFSVANLGPFDATGVTIDIQLPASAQSVSASVTNGACTVAPGSVTCVVAVLRTGTNVDITVNLTPTTSGTLALTARVFGDQPDADADNNATNMGATVAIMTDLSVTARGAATAAVGDTLTYTLGVMNLGPSTSTAGRLTYQAPAGVTLQSVSSDSANCSTSGNTLACVLNALAVGASTSVSITATAAVAGVQTATATVSTTEVDVVSANNSAIVTTTVAPAPPVATSPATPTTPASPANPAPTAAAATPAPAASASSTAAGGGGGIDLWGLAGLALLLSRRHRADGRHARV